MRRSAAVLRRDNKGTSAIEFALIAPVFFFLVFGILDIALISWFSSLVAEGTERGASYMREQRMAQQPITDDGIREAVCSSISIGGLSCDADRLKIGTYDASVPEDGGFGVPAIIENTTGPQGGAGDQYMVAVGYYWSLGLPTSKLLLPQGSEGSQIQGRTYTVLAERVSE